MSILTQAVRTVKTPHFPIEPTDDDFASFAGSIVPECYEPSEEDWAALRAECNAPIAAGEVSLDAWLAEQASYYRSLDNELGHGIAAEIERLQQLVAWTGSPRTWAEFTDRRDAHETWLQESLIERGKAMARDN